MTRAVSDEYCQANIQKAKLYVVLVSLGLVGGKSTYDVQNGFMFDIINIFLLNVLDSV